MPLAVWVSIYPSENALQAIRNGANSHLKGRDRWLVTYAQEKAAQRRLWGGVVQRGEIGRIYGCTVIRSSEVARPL